MNSNLRTGDTVLVIAGKNKGKIGKILKSDVEKGRVTVANVNIVSQHRKPRSQTDKGGIKKVESSINASNVQLVCSACGKATRIAHTFDDKGVKHRTCKKCKAFVDGEKKVKTSKPVAKEEPESKAKAPVAVKAEQKEKSSVKKETKARVASKAKVDTASPVRRKTPQSKSLGK